MKRSLTCLLALLLAISALTASAAERYTSVKGLILDTKGNPAVKHRIVFQPEGEAHTFLSSPSGEDGRYTVALPDGATVIPVAVITPVGRRIQLEGYRSLRVIPGTRQDINLGEIPAPAAAQPQPTPPPPPPEVIDETPPPAAQSTTTSSSSSTAAAAAVAGTAALQSAPPAAAPPGFARFGGSIMGATGKLIEGARVIYRQSETDAFFISSASDAAGEYTIEVPVEASYTPIAVVARNGRRTELDLDVPLEPNPEARYDIKVASLGLEGPSAGYRTFIGSDRLFFSFVEDTALVDSRRVEVTLNHASFDEADRTVSQLSGAFQISALPQMELGASIGYGNIDSSSGVAGGSGLTDLDLYAKISFEQTKFEWAVGGILNLTTGDSDSGLGQDSGGGKLFGAMRHAVGFGLLTANVGVELRGDGKVGGVPLEGKIAPAAGVGLIYPATGSLTVIGELSATGERFEDTDADVRLLGGTNWRIREILTLRTAISFGFTDGAPDWQLLVGYCVDF